MSLGETLHPLELAFLIGRMEMVGPGWEEIKVPVCYVLFCSCDHTRCLAHHQEEMPA